MKIIEQILLNLLILFSLHCAVNQYKIDNTIHSWDIIYIVLLAIYCQLQKIFIKLGEMK